MKCEGLKYEGDMVNKEISKEDTAGKSKCRCEDSIKNGSTQYKGQNLHGMYF
jgi:hypothetical protein